MELDKRCTDEMGVKMLSNDGMIQAEYNAHVLSMILPRHVANKARRGEPIKPENFDNTCIFFSDISKFTEISSTLPPSSVMRFLHRVYRVMDYCCKLFPELYKVETIGDSYMVCSGCTNDPTFTSPEVDIAEFAVLSMRIVRELVLNPVDK